ncbi:MAG: potassium transporter Kup [Burkholderiales bacterium]|nr:potassium transporter Kup [Burkholderiales bacterium]MDE1926773.1 potassium transporter Kup [Burkholderiales bacterium]MDE2160916.1 potassium transporter Kup [Burkholderiales bacterium]MDE2502462.1 potassium transporter Kup [Burkholderiales bacterium]
MSSPPKSKAALAATTLAAVGVVYGDIGTSPLYALKEVFRHGRVPPTPDNVLGVLSLVFWTLALVVSLKYVALILRADNNGEGGLIAMMALASQALRGRPRLRRGLLALGIFGTAIFFGDGVITPAISVLSAVEGLKIAAPGLEHGVVPLTLAVLTALFLGQRRGTAAVGRLFGPVMLAWFVAIGLLGIAPIWRHPEVLRALSPLPAAGFLLRHPGLGFIALGSVFLCVTGAEALYADLGHFGATPIRLAWFGIAMPALVLDYFGQGALLLADPAHAGHPFYGLAPSWAVAPLVVLATAATVIASQALISAAFSVSRQATQLGYLPRLRVLHTSVRDIGQIYVPLVNWALYGLVVLAVLLFGSSDALASAYGVAVATNMVITTLMTYFVLRYAWRLPLALCLAATAFFLCIDSAFCAANAVKVLDGGWLPLLIGASMYTLMGTWKQGRRLMARRLREESIALPEFLAAIFAHPPLRVSGTAVFLCPDPASTPFALLHNLKHNKVLHEQNLFVTVRHHEVPWIGFDRRCQVEPLGHDCWQVTLNFGFKNEPDLPEALQSLQSLQGRGVELDPMDTSYFLSRDSVTPTFGGGMAGWREKLFAGMHRNAAGAADFLHLPTDRIVELGTKIEI